MLRCSCPSHFRGRQISVETPLECTVTKFETYIPKIPIAFAFKYHFYIPRTIFLKFYVVCFNNEAEG
jgi:hypothetical protein